MRLNAAKCHARQKGTQEVVQDGGASSATLKSICLHFITHFLFLSGLIIIAALNVKRHAAQIIALLFFVLIMSEKCYANRDWFDLIVSISAASFSSPYVKWQRMSSCRMKWLYVLSVDTYCGEEQDQKKEDDMYEPPAWSGGGGALPRVS